MSLFEHIAKKSTNMRALVESKKGVHISEDDLKLVMI